MPSSSLPHPAAPRAIMLADENETFSTPPTTPAAWTTLNGHGHGPNDPHQPSLSRRNSRPTSLHIDHAQAKYNSNIELSTSPLAPDHNQAPSLDAQVTLKPTPMAQDSSLTLKKTPTAAQALQSPCFVHSQLDQGAALTQWLLNKPETVAGDLGVAKSLQTPRLQHATLSHDSVTSSLTSTTFIDDGDEQYTSSLTTKLAETAVGVREMSKQLGRARVQSNIQNILIVTKARDNRLIKLTRELALYLMMKRRRGQQRGLVVYVDAQLRHSRRFDAEGIRKEHPELFIPFPRRRPSTHSMSDSYEYTGEEEGQLRYWTSSMCSRNPHLFDFVVTLGGDGTVLFTSWLFQKIVPPVLPFALGSLGFLTNFDFADHQAVMDSVIDNGIRVNLRMRFTCTVYRAVVNEKGKGRKAVKKAETGEIIMKNLEQGGGWEALEGGFAMGEGKCGQKDREIMCYTTRPTESFEVLNDLVVDRGPSPYVSLLELFGDEHHMTTVQADGLTISTPTGSTAYSLSAGGSLVHPEIPAILITPICPHTLSFRPMLLPDSMELRICVPYNSRSTAWASFDGRGRVELKQGDHIKVTASKYPFPTVCADKQSTDWFHAISRTLKWNERERQKSFVDVEEDASKPPRRKKRNTATNGAPHLTAATANGDDVFEDEEDEVSDEEQEEDEQFDIDDSSAAESDATTGNGGVGKDHLVPPSIKRRAKSRSKSRSRTRSQTRSPTSTDSGVDSPSRFADARSPLLASKHVEFAYSSSNRSSPTSECGSYAAQHGIRDDIHSQKSPGNKSRIPRDRDAQADTPRTATAPASTGTGRGRGHSISRSGASHGRAFAVWGNDESDSNASDSDSIYSEA